ncbi:aromatic motif membrane protein [Mycoplasma sp. Z1473D]
MKKLKKLLISLLTLSASCTILSPSISAISNKEASNDIEETNKATAKEENDFEDDLTLKWKMFLKQEAISSLLDEIYGDDLEARNEYVAAQEALLHNKYIEKVSTALKYSNVITRQSSKYEEDSPYPWITTIAAFPYSVKEGDKIIDEANEKNWLWSLFNINRFTFMQNYAFTRNNNESQESFSLRDSENKLIYSIFSNIKSNNIIQFVKQGESSDDELHYYLLNENGFILKLDLSIYIDTETQKKNVKTKLFNYIVSYPKLLSASNKNAIFNLNKYVNLYGNFDLSNSGKTQTEEVLYKDYYGGILLKYAPVDVK